MRYSIPLAMFILVVININICHAQTSYSKSSLTNPSVQVLKITGKIPGLQENEPVVFLKYFHPFVENSWKPIDTAFVKDGKFSFEHYLNDGPRLLQLWFPKHKKMAMVVLGNENVKIESSWKIDEMPKEAIFEYLRFEGSDIANDFLYLSGIDRMWLNSLGFINNSITKYKDSILTKERLEHILGLMQAKRQINKTTELLFTHPFFAKRNAAICEYFTECYDADRKYDSLWLRVYNKCDEVNKYSYYGNIMKQFVPILIGQSAPDFSITSSDDKKNSLQRIAQENKVTILHFWSSHSTQRQKYHKELTHIYSKYHPKKLDIVNVSLDANPNKWKKAIEEDKMVGYQFCDFKEEESEPALMYKLNPKDITNILIDQNGKILAWDLEGPQLYAYLYSMFGE